VKVGIQLQCDVADRTGLATGSDKLILRQSTVSGTTLLTNRSHRPRRWGSLRIAIDYDRLAHSPQPTR
jgi:hypothetical protein